jgi:hypothetical protein
MYGNGSGARLNKNKNLAKDDEPHGRSAEPGSPQARGHGGQDMLRSVLLGATIAVMMSATAAMADDKSDCQKGLAMIKAELKKKHPAPVIATLRKALSDAETEVMEEDWSECTDYIKTARAALSK